MGVPVKDLCLEACKAQADSKKMSWIRDLELEWGSSPRGAGFHEHT